MPRRITISTELRQCLLADKGNGLLARCPKCGAIAIKSVKSYEPHAVLWQLCGECDYTTLEIAK